MEWEDFHRSSATPHPASSDGGVVALGLLSRCRENALFRLLFQFCMHVCRWNVFWSNMFDLLYERSVRPMNVNVAASRGAILHQKIYLTSYWSLLARESTAVALAHVKRVHNWQLRFYRDAHVHTGASTFLIFFAMMLLVDFKDCDSDLGIPIQSRASWRKRIEPATAISRPTYKDHSSCSSRDTPMTAHLLTL